MGIQNAAGTKLFIGTTAPANDEASFAADTYVEVGELESVGDFGDEFNQSSFTSLSAGRVRKTKGSADAGDMSFSYGLDDADPGQAALIEAHADTLSNYNVKVQYNGGEVRYFKGLVMSLKEGAPNADATLMVNGSIAINSPIVKVAA